MLKSNYKQNHTITNGMAYPENGREDIGIYTWTLDSRFYGVYDSLVYTISLHWLSRKNKTQKRKKQDILTSVEKRKLLPWDHFVLSFLVPDIFKKHNNSDSFVLIYTEKYFLFFMQMTTHPPLKKKKKKKKRRENKIKKELTKCNFMHKSSSASLHSPQELHE